MFGRAKKQSPTGRRVLQNPSGRPQSLSYHSSRVEQEYNLGRAQPRDQDIRRRERLVKFWRQRMAVLLMGGLVIACLGYILHLSSNPKVVPLTTSSNDYFLRPTDVYAAASAKLLKDSWLNSNKVTVNTDAVVQKLQQQFPELSSVSVTLPLMSHRPIVYIAPTAPSIVLQAQNGAYVLDTNGKALIPINRVADLAKLQLPTVVDQSDLAIKPDNVALPATSISFISTVIQELQAKGVTTSTISLPSAAYELDVTPAGAGYYVKFNLHDYQSARQQVGTYLAVQKRLSEQGITPASYVDVRLAGRAYYK